MVDTKIFIFGASSELAVEFNRKCDEQGIKTVLISRSKIPEIFNSEIIYINDYINEFEIIKKTILNCKNIIVIFFNGALYENRPLKIPTDLEIDLTKVANYTIPYELSKRLQSECDNVKKFIYISSIAAVKLRNKNFIYGKYKRKLEKEIKSLGLTSFVIFRFGKIFTSMSEGHKNPPFSFYPEKAASVILNKINKNNLVYPNFGLFMIAQILKILPKKIINFIGI